MDDDVPVYELTCRRCGREFYVCEDDYDGHVPVVAGRLTVGVLKEILDQIPDNNHDDRAGM